MMVWVSGLLPSMPAGDMELGSHGHDRTTQPKYSDHGSLSSFNGEWSVMVHHQTGPLPADAHGFVTTHRAGLGPVPSPHLADYNDMTHNTYDLINHAMMALIPRMLRNRQISAWQSASFALSSASSQRLRRLSACSLSTVVSICSR